MITPILMIRGNAGMKMLTYDLGKRRLVFWWDRSRNAHVAKFNSREEWLQAQDDIASARSVRWKVIADYVEGEVEIKPVEEVKTLAPEPVNAFSLGLSMAGEEPSPAAPPPEAESALGDEPAAQNDSAFEDRVQELKDTLKLSDLKERAKELNIPGRAKLTTQNDLARAIAAAERNPVTPAQ